MQTCNHQHERRKRERVEHQDEERDEIHDKLVEDLYEGQVRRDRALAKFAWYGAPDAPLVQRIGVCLIGCLPLAMGLASMYDALAEKAKEDKLIMGIVAMLLLYVGAR